MSVFPLMFHPTISQHIRQDFRKSSDSYLCATTESQLSAFTNVVEKLVENTIVSDTFSTDCPCMMTCDTLAAIDHPLRSTKSTSVGAPWNKCTGAYCRNRAYVPWETRCIQGIKYNGRRGRCESNVRPRVAGYWHTYEYLLFA